MEPLSLSEARIKFLEAYSGLEGSLSRLIQAILQVDSRIAWSIFYRVSSTRSSYSMIEDFIKVKHPELKKPWSVIERWLTPIDTARNHIVHWVPFQKSSTVVLANPATYMDMATLYPDVKSNEKTYTVNDVNGHAVDAVMASQVISDFISCIKGARGASPDKYLTLTNGQSLKEFHKLLRAEILGTPPQS